MGLRPVRGGGTQGCGGGDGGIKFPFFSTSCETPKGIQCCKMSIPLGVSQVVSYYKEWRKSGGRGDTVIAAAVLGELQAHE